MARHDPKSITSSPEWRRLSRAMLAEHPICQEPGCGRPSTHVHHKVARRHGGAVLDRANLVALCMSCHARHTAAEVLFGRPGSGMVRPLKGCDADGNPLAGWGARPKPLPRS